jgi:hypothetical protein
MLTVEVLLGLLRLRLLISPAKVRIRKFPTQRKSELGTEIGILELLLELYYDLMPNFCIKKSATSYCCL